MRVKMNVQTVHKGENKINGEEYTVDKQVGERWIKRGLATEVRAPTKKKESSKTEGDK